MSQLSISSSQFPLKRCVILNVEGGRSKQGCRQHERGRPIGATLSARSAATRRGGRPERPVRRESGVLWPGPSVRCREPTNIQAQRRADALVPESALSAQRFHFAGLRSVRMVSHRSVRQRWSRDPHNCQLHGSARAATRRGVRSRIQCSAIRVACNQGTT
jgi:hypothetical protein